VKGIFQYIKSFFTSLRELYLHQNLFYALAAGVLVMLFSYSFDWLWNVALASLALVGFYALVQIMVLFFSSPHVDTSRELPDILSLGDEQPIKLKVKNQSKLALHIQLTESLPYQLGVRKAEHNLSLKPEEDSIIKYSIRPTVRGVHEFGDYFCFISFWWPVIERRLVNRCSEKVAVYPSITQMKKFELYASKRLSNEIGVKRTRRIGHGAEFEQIKQYVNGDDPRTINWKASARTGHVMTNHFQEEKSQPVYQIIDTSRVMRMPFNELTLMDYSINSALALSNIILKKGDKTGLLTFDKRVNTVLEANNSSKQLKFMLRELYNQKISQNEANYQMLFYSTRKYISKRSFLILYTNFQSIYALERSLAELKAMSKRHLLLVVLFENTEVTNFSKKRARDLNDIYDKTIAMNVIREKKLIHAELERQGIMNISVTTETLTADVINKYLEVKSKGSI